MDYAGDLDKNGICRTLTLVCASTALGHPREEDVVFEMDMLV